LNLGILPEDQWLCPLPLFHVGGLSILFRSVIYGIPVILGNALQEGVTIVSVVSTMLQRMLEGEFPASLRCVLLGGGPASRVLLEQCAARRVPVVQSYGLTEAASQVATLAPEDALRKLGSAGKPLMPTELRIEDGEILVRGPTISRGYWKQQPREPDSWFRTGDQGYLDDEGYLYVLDRRDDLIVSGGENVYPAEVENVLAAHPAIGEAAVLPISDDKGGEGGRALIQLADGAPRPEHAELETWCRARLAAYKVPKRFEFVEDFPRTAAGKVQKHLLG
jgi:O-succinylbenzoic acid--CoA ligase